MDPSAKNHQALWYKLTWPLWDSNGFIIFKQFFIANHSPGFLTSFLVLSTYFGGWFLSVLTFLAGHILLLLVLLAFQMFLFNHFLLITPLFYSSMSSDCYLYQPFLQLHVIVPGLYVLYELLMSRTLVFSSSRVFKPCYYFTCSYISEFPFIIRPCITKVLSSFYRVLTIVFWNIYILYVCNCISYEISLGEIPIWEKYCCSTDEHTAAV